MIEYDLDNRGLIPRRGREFSVYHHIVTGLEAL
jgi:hypothetical protein